MYSGGFVCSWWLGAKSLEMSSPGALRVARAKDLITLEMSKLASLAVPHRDGDCSPCVLSMGPAQEMFWPCVCVGGNGCIFQGLACLCVWFCFAAPVTGASLEMYDNQVRLPPSLEQGLEAKALSPGYRRWCGRDADLCLLLVPRRWLTLVEEEALIPQVLRLGASPVSEHVEHADSCRLNGVHWYVPPQPTPLSRQLRTCVRDGWTTWQPTRESSQFGVQCF